MSQDISYEKYKADWIANWKCDNARIIANELRRVESLSYVDGNYCTDINEAINDLADSLRTLHAQAVVEGLVEFRYFEFNEAEEDRYHSYKPSGIFIYGRWQEAQDQYEARANRAFIGHYATSAHAAKKSALDKEVKRKAKIAKLKSDLAKLEGEDG